MLNDPNQGGIDGSRIGYMPEPATARLSQVEDQMNSLSNLTQDLEKIVFTIKERLSGVTRGADPKDEKFPAPPRPVLVPLAEKLRLIGDLFNQSINALRELNGAIELS